MKKIGITGSIASGKTTASKILSGRKGPLFSADDVVKKLYKKNYFKKLLQKKFDLKESLNLKKALRKKIFEKKNNIKKLEKIIHPLVRKEMYTFSKKFKYKKFLFFEIPLLIESKLMKSFDVIFFIKAKKRVRMKRFQLKGGDKKLFLLLDKKQMSEKKKIKYSDHVITNEKNVKRLRYEILKLFRQYE